MPFILKQQPVLPAIIFVGILSCLESLNFVAPPFPEFGLWTRWFQLQQQLVEWYLRCVPLLRCHEKNYHGQRNPTKRFKIIFALYELLVSKQMEKGLLYPTHVLPKNSRFCEVYMGPIAVKGFST